MASDGVRQGYDIAQLAAVRKLCDVPLIASGGAGTQEHFAEVFNEARRRRRAGCERLSQRQHRHSGPQEITCVNVHIEIRP